MQKVSVGPEQRSQLLEQLQDEHRRLEQRIGELERHLSLSHDEQRERAHLKKLKLAMKDQMLSLTRGHA
jgi:uncharacterized protein YdcH (DUF465 family)